MAKKCKKCGLLNLDSATECASCGSTEFESVGTLPTPQPVVPEQKSVQEPKKEEKPKKRHWKLIAGIAVAMILSLAGNGLSIWFIASNWNKLFGSSTAPESDPTQEPASNTTDVSETEKPDRSAPVITFAEPTVKVVIGTTFDESDNVESVVDDRDGILNEFARKPQTDTGYYILVSKEVDTSKAGDYTVTYNAYDTAGNRSEKSYQVIVAEQFYDAGYITSLDGITQSERDRIKGYADSSVRAKVAQAYKVDQSTIKYEGLMLISLKDSYADNELLPHNKYMLVYSATSRASSNANQVFYVACINNLSVKDDGSSTVVESEIEVESYNYYGSLSDVVTECVTSKSDKYNYALGDGMEAYDSPKVN